MSGQGEYVSEYNHVPFERVGAMVYLSAEALEAKIQEAAEVEREACAKIADQFAADAYSCGADNGAYGAEAIAAAIRGRQ